MASFRKRGKVWYFRYTDALGVKRERRGSQDKRVTERMAAKVEEEIAQIRLGIIDTDEIKRRKAAGIPLTQHLNDWCKNLEDQGHTAKHVSLSRDRVNRVLLLSNGCPPEKVLLPRNLSFAERKRREREFDKLIHRMTFASMDAVKAQGALQALRDAGLSLQTINHHRAAARAFSRWLKRTRRFADNPYRDLVGFNVKTDRRHERRAISLEELRHLIRVAHDGPDYRDMTGPLRALCYRLAVATGLRYAEIKRIRPGSFDLGGSPPTVTVPASYTKNREVATQAIPVDLAVDLLPVVQALGPEDPVFSLPDKAAEMLRFDLERAGIPYRCEEGRVFDFHALRCQLATLADQAGASPRTVQALMRHSSLELTGRYTKPRRDDLDKAIEDLPPLNSKPPKPGDGPRAHPPQ